MIEKFRNFGTILSLIGFILMLIPNCRIKSMGALSITLGIMILTFRYIKRIEDKKQSNEHFKTAGEQEAINNKLNEFLKTGHMLDSKQSKLPMGMFASGIGLILLKYVTGGVFLLPLGFMLMGIGATITVVLSKHFFLDLAKIGRIESSAQAQEQYQKTLKLLDRVIVLPLIFSSAFAFLTLLKILEGNCYFRNLTLAAIGLALLAFIGMMAHINKIKAIRDRIQHIFKGSQRKFMQRYAGQLDEASAKSSKESKDGEESKT